MKWKTKPRDESLLEAEASYLPALKPMTIKGKIEYDDTDLRAFLDNVMNTEILPRLQASKADTDFEHLGSEAPVGAGVDEDDIPF